MGLLVALAGVASAPQEGAFPARPQGGQLAAGFACPLDGGAFEGSVGTTWRFTVAAESETVTGVEDLLGGRRGRDSSPDAKA